MRSCTIYVLSIIVSHCIYMFIHIYLRVNVSAGMYMGTQNILYGPRVYLVLGSAEAGGLAGMVT